MEKADFVKLMEGVHCAAMVNACLSFGHELGVFDVLLSAEEPVSLQFIADSKNLKERYTRELLSALVSARILHQDRHTNYYSIPKTYKEEFKELIAVTSGIKVYLKRADMTLKCFRKDGPYGFECDDSEWTDWFHSFRMTSIDNTLDKELIPFFTENGVIPKLESGISVLDVGCGSASLTSALAKRFPNSNFTGLDISERGLQVARESVEKYNLKNIQFVKGDCHNLRQYLSSQFDLVFMYGTLHDLPNPHKALEEIYNILKNDGSFTLFDCGFNSNPSDNIGNMRAAYFYGHSLLHCLPSSMMEEPHIGYGACWGIEEMETALTGAKLKISRRSLDKEPFPPVAAYLCTK